MKTNIENFIFLPEVNSQLIKDKYPESYIAMIPSDLQTERDLMIAYEKSVNPPFFGRNWDSLNEILHDFSWINQKEVIIAHEDLPTNLNIEDIKSMLSVLSDAVQLLKDGPREGFELPDGKHALTVIFPLEAKTRIEEVLKQ